ncbi:DUF982 domain-containing protein [Rhizobium sp. 2MFCol3.1]|uniref:DUF982 domain-containing protein n=1 Tax=Rhizobium sp. 2MFCol3.1 TaxID=1246459 RepID=UPI00037A5291|nr:DUF982 domain-containing protein [Rhizobium sp. 2MFCol3.1]
MPNNTWNAPVSVDFPHQEQKVIGGPFEAMTCLTDRWPNMSGLKFLRARMACKAALDGRMSADDARVIFVEAVGEAGGKAH